MSGLSMPRICLPVFIVATFLTSITLWMNVEVAPKSRTELGQMFFKLAAENPAAIFVSDEVVSTLPGYVIYVEERVDLPDAKYQLDNLILVKVNDRRRPEAFVRAEQGIIGIEEGNRDDLQMDLRGAHIDRTASAESQDFIDSTHVRAEKAPLEISLAQLREKHRKDQPSQMTATELREEIKLSSDDEKRASELRTELHKRYSLSFACMTFVLIGIPLGVTAQRRETSVGFALSLIIAIGYFLFIVIAEMFHQDPGAYPHLLIWLPNIVFIALGATLFYRLSKR